MCLYKMRESTSGTKAHTGQRESVIGLHLATDYKDREDMKSQGLVALGLPGCLLLVVAMQLDSECCLVGCGKVDLRVLPTLPWPARGSGETKFDHTIQERDVHIQADVKPSRLLSSSLRLHSTAASLATAEL